MVVHIISGLNSGGAERSLFNILEGGAADRHNSVVISLTREGFYGTKLRSLGIPVYCLEMHNVLKIFHTLYQLYKVLITSKPNIVQGWMYHGNLVASLLHFLFRENPILIWNIRHSLYDITKENRRTRCVINVNKWLSKLPAKIIYNSQTALKQHSDFGFDNSSSIRIPNGVDLKKFHSKKVPSEGLLPWKSKESFSFVNVARYHPMKDHNGFIKAASTISRNKANAGVNFVLVGKNIDHSNGELTSLISDDFRKNFYFLGERSDIEQILNTIDCLVLSSAWGEGFPNVLIEAMASSIPCISTDVGDAADIVGDSGVVIPRGDWRALANAMFDMLNKRDQERVLLGESARKSIEENFSLGSIVDKYTKLYDILIFGAEKK